jgi:2-polyprenyl-6-methoxyphenol hydroxylase-like FAD-dependent oxidoreductase
MMANQLARRGIRARIIDRHSGPSRETRAIAVQARTLEIYSQLGLTERALELGKRGTGANMWANGRWMARIPLGDIGSGVSPFPFVLMLGQDDNERIMGDLLRDSGVAVEWNTELVAIAEERERVVATIREAGGATRAIVAPYLAGCDGARSAVRTLRGIDFPGAPYEHVFFVADTEATGPMVADELNVYLWQDGFHLLFPMRGTDHWRVVGIVPAELRGREGLRFEDVVPSLRAEAGSALAFRRCSWFSTYRIHHRCAERFRDGRCFLLGDAAHIHSPAGGQGMNTGLQDAYNLAWKLALVVAGRASTRLLDTYEAERRPVAERLLRTTDRAFSVLVSDRWMAGVFRTRLLARIAALAMRLERIQALAFRTISQTGIRYRESVLSRSAAEFPRSGPQPGDRFPWLLLQLRRGGAPEDLFRAFDDTCFNLVLFGEASSALRSGDLLRVHALPDTAHNREALAAVQIPRHAFYLLRPDGHIGLAGARAEPGALSEYLTRDAQLDPSTVRAMLSGSLVSRDTGVRALHPQNRGGKQ